MKLKHRLPLTIISAFAILLPMSAFAQDQNQDEKKQEKKAGGQQHGEAAAPQVATPPTGRSQAGNVRSEGKTPNASGGQGHVNQGSNKPATVKQPNVAPATTQSLQPSNRVGRSQQNQIQQNVAPATTQSLQPSNRVGRSQQNQIQSNVAPATSQSLQPRNRVGRSQQNQIQASSNQQAYNKGNNYGGLWFAENTHSDWNREGQHYWNQHNYRWYDGGWLIIDGGYRPYYSSPGSTAINVQIKLANEGYYRGSIDGDIGPGTRSAIADYQSDHDLRITGNINDPLLQSLQLE